MESRKTLINQGFFGYRGSFPLICFSWLLYKPYAEHVFPAGSNLKKFADLFDVIAEVNHGDNFEDAWRVFNQPYTGSTKDLPADNTLRRNFIQYINDGGSFGDGYGIILYNGKEKRIINA